MVTTKLNLSMTEPSVRQIYAKQGDTGRVLDISLDQTPEDGTLRILRPDGVEVTSEANTGGEVSESGDVVTFESLTEADVTELTVGIEPVQDLSNGNPSPTNICPITGHDEVTVTRTGINVWDEEWEQGNISDQTGENIPQSNIIRSKNYIPVKPSTTYYSTMQAGGVFLYGANKQYLGVLYSGFPTNFTTPDNCYFIRFRETGAYGSTYNNDISINYPSTDHDYHAYQGSTYTTSLGQTVYGGTLDMVTGQLVVDKVGFNPQLSTFNSITHYQSNFNSTNGIVSVRIGNSYLSYLGIDTTVATLKAKTISTLAPVFSGQAWNNTDAVGKMGVVDGLVFDYHYSTIGLSEWTTDGSTTTNAFYNTFGSSLFIVAPLAEPQAYTLTAQQIKTLIGTNNVWASSGDIVSIKFTYGGLLSELPSDATSVVGKCYCDVEQNGVSSMPFTLNVKKNERES